MFYQNNFASFQQLTTKDEWCGDQRSSTKAGGALSGGSSKRHPLQAKTHSTQVCDAGETGADAERSAGPRSPTGTRGTAAAHGRIWQCNVRVGDATWRRINGS